LRILVACVNTVAYLSRHCLHKI